VDRPFFPKPVSGKRLPGIVEHPSREDNSSRSVTPRKNHKKALTVARKSLSEKLGIKRSRPSNKRKNMTVL